MIGRENMLGWPIRELRGVVSDVLFQSCGMQGDLLGLT